MNKKQGEQEYPTKMLIEQFHPEPDADAVGPSQEAIQASRKGMDEFQKQ